MTRTLMLWTVLLSSLSVNELWAGPTHTSKAQKPKTAQEYLKQHKARVRAWVNAINNPVPQRKTRGGSRLIANSTYLPGGTPGSYDLVDTMRYKFNSNYGYDLTPEIFMQDYDLNLAFGTVKNYYDSLWQKFYDGTTLVDGDSSNCTFTTNHKLSLERGIDRSSGDYFSSGSTYNAAELLSVQTDTTISGTDTTAFKIELQYDGMNRLIRFEANLYSSFLGMSTPVVLDSLFYTGTNLSSVKEYEYDAMSMGWVPSTLYNFTYNASNLMTEVLEQAWSGTAWENDLKTVYAYNGSNKHIATTYSNWMAGAWENDSRDSFSYSTFTYPISSKSEVWNTGAWVNESRNAYTFNSSNQVLTTESDSWGGSNWVPQSKDFYYYENFTPQGLTQMTALEGDFFVYPVPAGNQITVQAKLNEPVSQLTILDVRGRVVREVKLNASAQIRQEVQISDLPAGTYILKLNSDRAAITRTFSKK